MAEADNAMAELELHTGTKNNIFLFPLAFAGKVTPLAGILPEPLATMQFKCLKSYKRHNKKKILWDLDIGRIICTSPSIHNAVLSLLLVHIVPPPSSRSSNNDTVRSELKKRLGG